MWRTAAASAVVGSLYFISASASLLLTRFDGGIAFLWIASAMLLAHLLRSPAKTWWPDLVACAAASMAASALYGAGPAPAPLFAAVQIGEAAFGAMLLRRVVPDQGYFDSLPAVGLFVLVIGAVMPAASALAGASIGALVLGADFWPNLFYWFTSHALGALTLLPIGTLLLQPETYRALRTFDFRRHRLDIAILLLAIVIDFAVFMQPVRLLLYVPILPLIPLTFRLGRVGAASAILLLAVIGGTCTVMNLGPIALLDETAGDRTLFFHFYLAVAVLIVLPVSAELSQRGRLQRRLETSEALFRQMAERAGDIVLNITPDGRIVYVSAAIENIGGFQPWQIIGRSVPDLVIEGDRPAMLAAHIRTLAFPDEPATNEYRAQTANNGYIWIETNSRAIVDSNGGVTSIVATVRDITHRKAAEIELAHIANTDTLTGLPNRRLFDAKLDQAFSARDFIEVGCLAVIDVDFFKSVNDYHGHPGGDEVLRQLARTFRSEVRSSDTIARIGGEEFGLILGGLGIEDAEALCNRLREAVAAMEITLNNRIVSVTVSIGLAALTDHRRAADLLKAADAALYRAKSAGRNRLRLAA